MKIVTFVARALGVLLAAIVVLTVALLAHGYGLAHKTVSNPVPALVVGPDSSQIPRGAHLSQVICAGCHAPGLAGGDTLSGGTENFFVIPKGPTLGVLYAPNLTPGGPVAAADNGELSRAIREGVGFVRQPLIVMPSNNLRNLSDRDLAAIIASMRAQPVVAHETPKRQLNPLAYLILGLHQAETSAQLPVPRPIPDLPEAPSAEYGAYFASVVGCSDCHGRDLKGAPGGQLAPHGSNLVGLAHEKPFETFELAVRHGVKPSGGTLDPTLMPWTIYAHMNDTEVRAIYESLKRRPL
jgi:mono/diheme cytochrome c family protein